MSSSSSKFASFAPYTPPPDDPIYTQASTSKATRAWFPNHNSSPGIDTSYQYGGIPTFASSLAGGQGAAEEGESQQNQWETRFGMRVDLLAAAAYILGPISALVILITETQNDYVRFHAYQSALLSTPLIILRILFSLLLFPSWLRSLFTVAIFASLLCMGVRAYIDATRNGLGRYQLPYIGTLAEEWVAEE